MESVEREMEIEWVGKSVDRKGGGWERVWVEKRVGGKECGCKREWVGKSVNRKEGGW